MCGAQYFSIISTLVRQFFLSPFRLPSPARVARFQVLVGLMAPWGDNVFTPVEETCCCATDGLAAIVTALIKAADIFDIALLVNRGYSEIWCHDWIICCLP